MSVSGLPVTRHHFQPGEVSVPRYHRLHILQYCSILYVSSCRGFTGAMSHQMLKTVMWRSHTTHHSITNQ